MKKYSFTNSGKTWQRITKKQAEKVIISGETDKLKFTSKSGKQFDAALKLSKEYKAQEKVVLVYRKYKKLLNDIKSNKEIISQNEDDELVSLAKEELKELEENVPTLEHELKILLLPKDPNDDKNVILEIRAGAGGDEASIFAGDLFRMYTRYVESLGWKCELMSASESGTGGYK